MRGGGLNLGVGGRVGAFASIPGSTTPAPQTVTQAAFGTSPSASTGSRVAAVVPNDATGIAFWCGVVGIAGLLLIRHSLPN